MMNLAQQLVWKPPRMAKDGVRKGNLVEFTLGRKNLKPADLLEVELPKQDAARSDPESGLLLGGRGPLWLYAHLVGQAIGRGWPWVAIYDPRFGGGVIVARQPGARDAPRPGEIIRCSPVPDTEDQPDESGRENEDDRGSRPNPIRLALSQASEGTWVYRLEAPGSGRAFQPRDLEDLLARIPAPSGSAPPPEVLVLSGLFPVWLASALVAELVWRHPGSAVAIDDPKVSGAVVVGRGTGGQFPLGMVIPDREPDVPVPVLAVIGDPNSGKSVLSWKLYWALQRRRLEVYRLDCDASAPTTGWSQAGTTGRELRERYKQERGDWTPEDEAVLAATITRLRQSHLDLVLLDMPGGIHKHVPSPIRIPPGREAMFRPVDGFIVLTRDERALTGWTEALGAWNLEGRILAIVEPRADTTEKEIIPDGDDEVLAFRRWRIHGLDRSLYELSTPGVESLADWLVATKPWEADLNGSGRRPGSGSPPTGSLS